MGHLLRYIRHNKTSLFKYNADQNDAHVSDLLRQSNNKTENHLLAFSDFSWQFFSETGINTGAYIIFYQDGPIDHGTNVPGLVVQ